MPELVRCKPCGYVSRKDALKGVCPACGASLKAFEPYEDRVSARRRLILNLDLHPILVHTPQTFATLLPALAVFALLFPGFYSTELTAVICFAALFLPVTVVGAILSGLIDGKMKFKRLTTPLVIRKIVIGVSLLIVSAANAVIVLVSGFHDTARILVLSLGAGCFVCAVLLGTFGKKLILPILPGQ